MAILIDKRAGSDELAGPLSKLVKCEVKLDMLSSGDVAFEGNAKDETVLVGLEFKTVPDLLASLQSGRYQDQMRRMSQDYQVCYLLVEGQYSLHADSGRLKYFNQGAWVLAEGMYFSRWMGMLSSVEVVENVVIRRSIGRSETLAQLAALYEWWQKPWNNHKSSKMIKMQASSVFGKDSTFVIMASQIPGVGPDMAKRLEKHFGTFEALVEAEARDITEVDGIGPKRAMHIYQSFRGKS